jgi:hypothetical protein
MADMRITFTGPGKALNNFIFDLFETDSLGEGTQKELPGGAKITVLPITVEKSAELTRVVEVMIHLGRDVAVGLVANYFYDKWKAHRSAPITMFKRRREIQFEKSEITKILEEEIEVHGEGNNTN